MDRNKSQARACVRKFHGHRDLGRGLRFRAGNNLLTRRLTLMAVFWYYFKMLKANCSKWDGFPRKMQKNDVRPPPPLVSGENVLKPPFFEFENTLNNPLSQRLPVFAGLFACFFRLRVHPSLPQTPVSFERQHLYNLIQFSSYIKINHTKKGVSL